MADRKPMSAETKAKLAALSAKRYQRDREVKAHLLNYVDEGVTTAPHGNKGQAYAVELAAKLRVNYGVDAEGNKLSIDEEIAILTGAGVALRKEHKEHIQASKRQDAVQAEESIAA